MDRRVVVTGMGIVSPIGLDLDSFWSNMINGVSGVDHIKNFDTKDMPIRIAGEIIETELQEKELICGIAREEDMSRVMRFALLAAKMALDDACLLDSEDFADIGVCLGASLNRDNFFQILELINAYGYENLSSEVEAKMGKLTNHCDAHSVVLPIVEKYKLTGPVSVIHSACSSGAQAIGEAFRMIRNNEIDMVLCGGIDSFVCYEELLFFNSLGVLSKNSDPKKASCPFDKNRDGFVVGEGAGLVILESLESALKRRARIWAEVAGYSCLSETYHISSPDPSCKIQKETLLKAFEDSKIRPEEVDMVNAHGTSTKYNDQIETNVLKEVFGQRAYEIPVTANKSITGHLVSAAGAVEFISTVKSVHDNVVPPTINYINFDEDCDLDYVPDVKREKLIKTAITQSFAFGGQDVCIVVKKIEMGG